MTACTAPRHHGQDEPAPAEPHVLFPAAPVHVKVQEAHDILDRAIGEAATDGKAVAATVILFSGGDDSTVLAHLFKTRATHAAHANTGIGIEQTRQFVRDCCTNWDLPLLEKHCRPGRGYRELVLGQVPDLRRSDGQLIKFRGFPGPASHGIMFAFLKERAVEAVKRDLVERPREQRVIFLSGIRREESARRSRRVPVERKGSAIWVNPLIGWTKLDLNAYRRQHPDVPRNEVAALLHMSGECLCGAFAHPGELDEIDFWFPDVAAAIRQLEAETLATGTVPPERCKWGWGLGRERPSRSGPMCSSCDARFEQLALFAEGGTP